jgi:tRNA nucleotidyltransferase (CCA-adding enzyme)
MKGQSMINIPEEPNWIITKLMENGYDAYVVGGCVRDSIFGKIPKDWDICTNANPLEVKSVFESSRIVDTGLKHGTVTIVLPNGNYEVTTYRIDGKYSDGRRPDSVSFTDSLKEDLSRRDFTINAMAYNNVVGLVDYFNGEDDLKSHTIRCVGNSDDRFKEDALRIIRALRFSSILCFEIHPNTKSSIDRNYKLLNKVSIERISSEFNKMLCGEYSYLVLEKYYYIIAYIIPEIRPTIGFKQHNPYHVHDVWKHTIYAISCSQRDLEVRLALFFHDIGKPKAYTCPTGIGHFYKHHLYSEEITKKILKRMKYDNKTIDNVCTLVYNHSVPLVDTKKSIRRMLNVVGDLFEKLLDVKFSDMYAQSPMSIEKKKPILENVRVSYREILAEEDCFNLKDLAINGKDLIAIGYPEGQKIGTTLNQLLSKVIDGDLENTKDALLAVAKENL